MTTTDDDRLTIFQRIEGKHVHDSVVDQITFAIRSATYEPGDKLPSMDQLAAQLGVSKPVIGEAIRTLSAAGVIAAQRGNRGGLRVLTNNIPTALMGLSSGGAFTRIPAILEARRAIEMELAFLCASRATEHDFAEMQRANDLLGRSRADSVLHRRHWDHLFHYQMARAAGSEMLAYYQHQVLERLTIVLEDYFDYVENPEEVEWLHQDTLDALRGGDQDEIRAAIDRHLSPLERAFATSPPTT